MKTTLLLLSAFTSIAFGQDRSGGPYSIRAEALSAGGGAASAGPITLVSVITPQPVNEQARRGQGAGHEINSGWLPLLVKPTAFKLHSLVENAGPSTAVDEGQEAAALWALEFDDSSYSVPPPAEVHWSVLNGPLSFVQPARVTGGAVFQDSTATLRGQHRGLMDTLVVTVRNVQDDNYGPFAADAMDDAWQILHFGQDIAAAQATADPDDDGLANVDEFRAGTVPTDAASRFELRFLEVNGIETLQFTPWRADRAYALRVSDSLGTWSAPISEAFISGWNGVGLMSNIDQVFSGPRRFFRLEPSVPGFRP